MPKTAKEKEKRTRKRTIVSMGTKDTLEEGYERVTKHRIVNRGTGGEGAGIQIGAGRECEAGGRR